MHFGYFYSVGLTGSLLVTLGSRPPRRFMRTCVWSLGPNTGSLGRLIIWSKVDRFSIRNLRTCNVGWHLPIRWVFVHPLPLLATNLFQQGLPALYIEVMWVCPSKGPRVTQSPTRREMSTPLAIGRHEAARRVSFVDCHDIWSSSWLLANSRALYRSYHNLLDTHIYLLFFLCVVLAFDFQSDVSPQTPWLLLDWWGRELQSRFLIHISNIFQFSSASHFPTSPRDDGPLDDALDSPVPIITRVSLERKMLLSFHPMSSKVRPQSSQKSSHIVCGNRYVNSANFDAACCAPQGVPRVYIHCKYVVWTRRQHFWNRLVSVPVSRVS